MKIMTTKGLLYAIKFLYKDLDSLLNTRSVLKEYNGKKVYRDVFKHPYREDCINTFTKIGPLRFEGRFKIQKGPRDLSEMDETTRSDNKLVKEYVSAMLHEENEINGSNLEFKFASQYLVELLKEENTRESKILLRQIMHCFNKYFRVLNGQLLKEIDLNGFFCDRNINAFYKWHVIDCKKHNFDFDELDYERNKYTYIRSVLFNNEKYDESVHEAFKQRIINIYKEKVANTIGVDVETIASAYDAKQQYYSYRRRVSLARQIRTEKETEKREKERQEKENARLEKQEAKKKTVDTNSEIKRINDSLDTEKTFIKSKN